VYLTHNHFKPLSFAILEREIVRNPANQGALSSNVLQLFKLNTAAEYVRFIVLNFIYAIAISITHLTEDLLFKVHYQRRLMAIEKIVSILKYLKKSSNYGITESSKKAYENFHFK